MSCYLITRYEVKAGRFVTSYGAGELAAVIAEARRIAANASPYACEVFVDKPTGQHPDYISVVLRQPDQGETVSVYKAERSQTEPAITDDDREAAAPDLDAGALHHYLTGT